HVKRLANITQQTGLLSAESQVPNPGGPEPPSSDIPEFTDAEEEKLFEFLNLQLEKDLSVEQIRHYEVVYLIHEDCLEEVPRVISKVEDFLKEKKGEIWRLNNWGLRKLAYKIKKANYANYVLMNFEIEAKWINDFKSMLDKDERVIRHLVIKRDEAITEDCPPPPEFHTLRANSMEECDDDADGFDEEEDAEDRDELDMVGYDENDANDGIVY
ncbi:protein REGULATOR OF FATTY ACID COMPOSITION 3, chloroplastic-like, partial [Aristolochia californica]|uniref:protein REGULATOR OF FATTY ACID COMPOSITION 3, chloroplastic-like n=1 Tax=Aristolochia californica TaxID=171875 RepID=UPI0035D968AB